MKMITELGHHWGTKKKQNARRIHHQTSTTTNTNFFSSQCLHQHHDDVIHLLSVSGRLQHFYYLYNFHLQPPFWIRYDDDNDGAPTLSIPLHSFALFLLKCRGFMEWKIVDTVD